MKRKEPLLRLDNVGKEFFGNKVLDKVNFSVAEGEIVGLVGENGAGKSTIMNILFGSSVISSTGGYEGKVYLHGSEVSFANPFEALEAGLGMVHQEFSLIPGFTAAENIVLNRETTQYNFMVELFGDRLSDLDREDMILRACKATTRLGINIPPDTLVSDMSVGQKQFTEIAREIENADTKLLLLDEPTAVLTESEARTLMDSLRRLSPQGLGIIFISHRLREIKELCDRVVVLRDGLVISDVPTAETEIEQIAEWMVGRKVGRTAVRKKDISQESVLLNIKDLWVDMPGETLKGLDLDVYEGEILGVGGLAGQGKLALANGLMGIFPARGEVEYNGKPFPLCDTAKAIDGGLALISEDRRGQGLLLDEELHLNIAFTALQSKGLFLKKYLCGLLTQLDFQETIRRANEFIESLNIKCTGPRQRVIELSGGNQQKVCLAKAFVCEPKLLFASEPTRGIDVGAKKMVLDVLRKYNEEYNTTIIMTSSELEELRSICDRIAIVSEGKVAGILPPDAKAKEFGLLMS